MDWEKLRFHGWAVLDKLKSKHQADTNRAEIEMTLLADRKNKEFRLDSKEPNLPWFRQALHAIWFAVARKCWVDVDELLEDL